MRRNHTREFKLQCCRQVSTGEKRPPRSVASTTSLRACSSDGARTYEARGEAAFTEKQPSANEALQARIAENSRHDMP